MLSLQRSPKALLLALFLWMPLLEACSSRDITGARQSFYNGDLVRAKQEIGTEPVEGKDAVLILMERGTIYQASGEWQKSSDDFIEADSIIKRLETYSLSEGAGSWIANDTTYSFEGEPFEQTLLHSMTALNHLAMNNWEDGGVEARRIIYSLKAEERGREYPDDAFSRYLAAFILEATGDLTNAATQYQLADELLSDITIGGNGHFDTEDKQDTPDKRDYTTELVCFFLIGRAPAIREQRFAPKTIYPPEIEIHSGNTHLGNAFIVSSVYDLSLSTWNIEAPARIAKMAARIAAKEAMAQALENQDAALGALARIILIGMLERPDSRRWETLPRWLAVARLPCPDKLSRFEVIIRQRNWKMVKSITVERPIIQHGNLYFSIVRDLPGFNSKENKKDIDKTL